MKGKTESYSVIIEPREIARNKTLTLDLWIKIVSAFGVIVGIFFTGYQIGENSMVREAELVYKIQSDGRNIQKRLSEIEHYHECVHYGKECGLKELRSARNGIRYVLQFYSSVGLQYKRGVIERDFWDISLAEICEYLQIPIVANYWKEYSYAQSEFFLREVEKCP